MDRRPMKKRSQEEDGDDCKKPAAPSHGSRKTTLSSVSLKPASMSNINAEDEGDIHSDFDNGDRIIICNLVDAPELNGKKGTIVQYHSTADRFTIELDKNGLASGAVSTVFIKPGNLTLDKLDSNGQHDDFAEVFPDTMGKSSGGGGGTATLSTADNDAKMKAAASCADRATMPGAVAIEGLTDQSSFASRYGDDDGLKELSPPNLSSYPAQNAKHAPETFSDTTNRRSAGKSGAEAVAGVAATSAAAYSYGKNDIENGLSKGSQENSSTKPKVPGAVHEGGIDSYHSYDDDDDGSKKLNTDGRGPLASPTNEELAIAAEVVQDDEDVEAKVQAQVEERLQRESNAIESQIQKRILDEAVHADVVIDDSEEKMTLFRRKMMLLGCCAVILVVVVVVVVFVVRDDSDLTANPTLSPTWSSSPSLSPTLSPSTAPTSSPTPVPRCTLCAGIENYNLTENITSKEFFLGGSCGDFLEEQERQFNKFDTQCLEGQALAWLHCDCPDLPPLPDSPSCTLCSDGSIPTDEVIEDGANSTDANGTCANYNTYVAIMSSNPLFSCSVLARDFVDTCYCPLEPSRLEFFAKILEPISGDALLDEESAQYKALSWLVSKDPAYLSETAADEDIQQRYVAALLYFVTGGESWTFKNNFLSGDEICSWNNKDDQGIFCDDGDVVYNITLSDNNLISTVPAEIMLLSNLEKFDVSENSLTGVPASIISSKILKELILSDNPWKNGTTSIPESIGLATSLERFRCDRCGLVSSIPETISGLAELSVLTLEENTLTGMIPNFANATKMKYLYLRDNELSGPIPPSLGNLSSLNQLFLSQNSLTSSIPRNIGSLPSLVDIDLTRTDVTGEVPPFTGENVSEIWLYGNRLSGNLDKFFNSSSPSLTEIRLYDNFLTGTISSHIGRLVNLTYVGLGNDGAVEARRNSITGAIPSEIGLLTEIDRLSFYDLDLESSIPSEIGRLTKLVTLVTVDNGLTGNIPSEIGNCRDLSSLFLQINQLSGTVPKALGTLPDLEIVGLHGNNFVGNLDNVFCRREDLIDTLYASCGTGSGLICGCCSVCCSKSGDQCFVPAPSTLSPTTTPTYVPTNTMMPVAASHIEFFASVLEPISGDSLLDETSVQYDALLWTARKTSENATTEEIQQRYVVALLFFSTGGQSWNNHLGFLSADDVCFWNDGERGIFCNENATVDRISLNETNLKGPIPDELVTLKSLRIINLTENSITGTIPERLGELSMLEKLNLASNIMKGALPESVFSGPALKEVLLSKNNWKNLSVIPEAIGNSTNLEVFECRLCNLVSSIPESISYLSMLRRLELRDNSLTGEMPSFLMNKKMEYLSVTYNDLEGSLRNSLGNLTKLEYLWAHGNNFNSTIPPDLGNLPSLKSIDLGLNNLTGTIPPFYGSELEEVWLVGSGLSGNLDRFLNSSSTSLSKIRFDANFLTGTISSDIGRFTNLTTLHLGQNSNFPNGTNNIEGLIPTEIGLLTNMEDFRLSSMDMDGIVLSEIGLLTALETLILFNLTLTNTIPTELGLLTNLEILDLGENDLTGVVPSEIGNCEKLKALRFNWNQLDGNFPESVGSLPELELLWIEGNDFTDNFEDVFCQKPDPIDNLTVTCGTSCTCCTNCCTVREECTDLTLNEETEQFVPTISPTKVSAPADIGTGSECTDDLSWTYVVSNGNERDCSWVEIDTDRCDKVGTDGVPACCACCETCQDYTGDCSCS